MELYQQTKKLMGTDVVLTLVTAKTTTQTQAVFADIWRVIVLFDKRFSRFRQDSELTALNTNAGEWVDISEAFYELLKVSRKMSVDTGGIFNPFILPALSDAGYKSSWAPTPETANPPDFSDRRVVSPEKLKIEKYRAKIPAGTAIDLGGIGKGFLLDKLGDIAEANEINNYWFSLGGDILARGYNSFEASWQINIAKAAEPKISIASVEATANNRIAITTSGVTKRRGRHNGKGWHHIIDPSSGKPAKTDILTASLTMPSAIEADVFASCLVGLGSSKAKTFIKSHQIKDSLLQVAGQNGPTFKLTGDRFVMA